MANDVADEFNATLLLIRQGPKTLSELFNLWTLTISFN
jgi:hypothetical protein